MSVFQQQHLIYANRIRGVKSSESEELLTNRSGDREDRSDAPAALVANDSATGLLNAIAFRLK